VYLDFGTAIHAGLQAYYDPLTWDDPEGKKAAALGAFLNSWKGYKANAIRVNGKEILDEHVEMKWKENLKLGHDMLMHYFSWAPSRDTRYRPLYTEIEFEVPIPVPHMFHLPERTRFEPTWEIDHDRCLLYVDKDFVCHRVLYQGKIDLIVQDEAYNEWVIVEHKTAGQLSSTEWLALDEQCGSYIWAILGQLGTRCGGVIYNQLAKKAPHPPKVLKSGSLSVAKNQDTTWELYHKTILDIGQKTEWYQDFLNYLRDNPKEFVRRTEVRRNIQEMDRQGVRILLEAIDMLSNPSIYPAPGPMNCNGCWYINPCIAQQEEGDPQFILENNYHKRESTNA
jgi:hypothetical protein